MTTSSVTARFHPDGTHRDKRPTFKFRPVRERDGAVEGILDIGTEVDD